MNEAADVVRALDARSVKISPARDGFDCPVQVDYTQLGISPAGHA